MSHFIEICKVCECVISQCRCPSPDKEKRYGVCNACKAKETPEESIVERSTAILENFKEIYGGK